jgi:hypothetical protein
MDKRLKCKILNYESTSRNKGEMLENIGMDKDFLNKTPKAWEPKAKIGKWDFIN